MRSSFFFTTDFAGRRGTAAGHRGRASRHRGRAQIPKIRGPRGSNTQNQGSQGLKYPKTGVPARLWRIFSGYPLAFIRSKIRPNIRKIRNFWSGIHKIRIHPLVGTPAVGNSACLSWWLLGWFSKNLEKSFFKIQRPLDFLRHEIFCDRNVGLPALGQKMFLSTVTPYWHVTQNFMVQKVLEITQILTLRIEGL